MLKLILIVNFLFFYLSNSYAYTAETRDECSWANDPKIPCITIKKKINNTSEFTKSSINKYTIKRKEIDSIGASDLVDILKTIPGFNLTQSGPKGQQTSLFLRGTGSNHTLVMINGIAINDQSTTQGLHDFGVDFIQTIQQIEVYPGSSATQFGSNAIGGAVNIILTGDYQDKFHLSTDRDSNFDLFSNKTFYGNKDNINVKIGIIENETTSARIGTNEDKDKVKNLTTNINHERYISPSTKYFNTIYARQTVAEYDGSATNQKGYEGDNKMLTVQTGLITDKIDNDKEIILYYTKYDREYDENGTIDTYYSDMFGSKYQYSNLLNQNVSYSVGADYAYNWGKFNNNGSYTASTKGNNDNLGLFTNAGIKISDNTRLSLFGRNDKHKRTGNNSTYKINLTQKINNLEISASRSTSLRNPTLYELFGTDNFGYSGNKNLKPEKSLTNEISILLNLRKIINISSSFYRSNISNNIEYINNRYVNEADNIDLNQEGVDSQIEINMKNFNIRMFSSILSSKKENGNDQLRRPRKNYGINLSQEFKNEYLENYSLNILYNHYGKHFDTHSSLFSTIEMDSTDIVDVKISKKLNKNSYFIKITNLLDEKYQRPHGYGQEGRIIKFGLNF